MNTLLFIFFVIVFFLVIDIYFSDITVLVLEYRFLVTFATVVINLLEVRKEIHPISPNHVECGYVLWSQDTKLNLFAIIQEDMFGATNTAYHQNNTMSK